MCKDFNVFLFDLDGTITDSSVGITNSVMYALKKYGIDENDRTKLYKFIGPPLADSFQKYYGFSSEQSLEAIKYYREYYTVKGIYENLVYEGFENVVKELKARGKTLAVATSKPEIFAKEIIRYFNLEQYFSCVAGIGLGEEINKSKADVIADALERLGCKDKSKVLMVGDRMHDVEGARLNQISCIGVLYGFGTRDELEKAGATYIAETVNDILNIKTP